MDIEEIVRRDPILRWFVLPIILALIFSFSDYADASEHRINLDAEKVFKVTRGKFYSGDKNKPENYAQFPRDCTCAGGTCSFWGDMDLDIGTQILKYCSVTFYYNRNDNKVFKYALNRRTRNDDEYFDLIKYCIGKYGKPANVGEDVRKYFGWTASDKTIIGGSVEVTTYKVIWDFPDFRCTVSMTMDSLWLVEENK